MTTIPNLFILMLSFFTWYSLPPTYIFKKKNNAPTDFSNDENLSLNNEPTYLKNYLNFSLTKMHFSHSHYKSLWGSLMIEIYH